MSQNRKQIPYDVQVEVFFRDGWLCRWCYQPTIFAPAIKYLEDFVKSEGYSYPLAYYDMHYRRDTAPILDHFASVINHVEALSNGGTHDKGNFVTACNKCNMLKNNSDASNFLEKKPGKPVMGRYGEPKYWDGFTSLFLVLAERDLYKLTLTEKKWYKALKDHLKKYVHI